MAGETTSVSSTAGVFEPPRFLRPIRRRIMGRWRILAFPVAPMLVVVLVAISIALVMEMPPDYRLAAPGSIHGSVVRQRGRHRVEEDEGRMACTRSRGVPARITSTYSIRPEGLQVESEVATTLIRWPFINEIMLVDGHWLLISTLFGFGISRTCFGLDAEERAFLTALLMHLEPSARARSQKAERVISRQPNET